MNQPMTNAEVATFAALVDSYESNPARDAMGLPAGYGVVNLDTVRRLLATIHAPLDRLVAALPALMRCGCEVRLDGNEIVIVYCGSHVGSSEEST